MCTPHLKTILFDLGEEPIWGQDRGVSDFQDPRSRVDLHGLRREDALVRVQQTLTRARALGLIDVQIITGRGLGNRAQEPVLRKAVEAWLKSPAAKPFQVVQVQRIQSGGALSVRLRRRD